MQIMVAGAGGTAPLDDYNPATLTTLDRRVPARPPGHRASSQLGQEPIIVGQTAYNSAYNTTFPATWPNWGISRISDTSISFQTVDGTIDEQFRDEAEGHPRRDGRDLRRLRTDGRQAGARSAVPNAAIANFVLQNYVDPPTEIVKARRGPDLEDHPQWRGHAPHPLPPVRRAGDQPGRLGRVYQTARPQRTGLEGHRQDQPAGGHDRRAAAGHSPGALRAPQQHSSAEPGSALGLRRWDSRKSTRRTEAPWHRP